MNQKQSSYLKPQKNHMRIDVDSHFLVQLFEIPGTLTPVTGNSEVVTKL